MGLFRRRQRATTPLPTLDRASGEWVQILGDGVPTPVAKVPPPYPPRPVVTIRREDGDAEPATAVEPAPPARAESGPGAIELTPRIERALLALAAHAHQLEDRLRRLEDRMDHAEHVPTHEDLIEVRMHSARNAAELARVTVQLQAEIDAARQQPTPESRRIDALAEQVLALWDQLEALPVRVPADDPAAEVAEAFRRRDDGTGPGLVAIA